MITVLLEKIITILEGWIQSFTSHAQHVEDKLDSLDQTASDIETNTEPISDIADNTGAVITPIQNIKSNTDSIKQSSQTSANNTTAILNNISTLSTNTGRAAAYAQDCANNTLDIKDKVTTIASDTTQLRADTSELNDMSDKIYEAIKWSLVDKVITETVEGTDTVSFDTDLANDLVSLEASIKYTQSGTGDPSPSNIRLITGVTDKSITANGNNITIALGQTVYGSTINLTTGLLKINRWFMKKTWGEGTNATVLGSNTRKTFSLGTTNLNVYPPSSKIPQICNIAKYSASFASDNIHFYCNASSALLFLPNDTANDTVIQFSGELTTPIEVQLTPTQIATIKGINTISTDGSIKATYEESIKHYLDKQDN